MIQHTYALVHCCLGYALLGRSRSRKSQFIFHALDEKNYFEGPLRYQDTKLLQLLLVSELIAAYIKSPE
jgi:hypothetical protein